jgi:hypothetical protein
MASASATELAPGAIAPPQKRPFPIINPPTDDQEWWEDLPINRLAVWPRRFLLYASYV